MQPQSKPYTFEEVSLDDIIEESEIRTIPAPAQASSNPGEEPPTLRPAQGISLDLYLELVLSTSTDSRVEYKEGSAKGLHYEVVTAILETMEEEFEAKQKQEGAPSTLRSRA